MSKTQEIIDAQVVEQLKALDDGKGLLLSQLFALFVSQSHEKISALKEAIRNEDRKAVAFHAHALKSGCATVGALKMSFHCVNLEQIATSASRSDLQKSLGFIESEFDVAQKLLKSSIDSHLNSA